MMLTARRAVLRSPVLARQCSFLTHLKELEDKTSKMKPVLPAGLLEVVDAGHSATAAIRMLSEKKPELYKAVLAAIAEADKPGIKATVAVAKDPSSCKYTVEGTIVHDFLKTVAKSDRRQAFIKELEVTLTAEDKAAMAAAMKSEGFPAGATLGKVAEEYPSVIDEAIANIPDKVKLGAML